MSRTGRLPARVLCWPFRNIEGSGAFFGLSWARLGGVLGASGSVLGSSEAPPEPLLGLLSASQSKNGYAKHVHFPKGSERNGTMFASWGSLGGPLGALLGRLRGLLDRLGAILGRLGGLLDRLGPNLGVLERSWTVLEPSWTPLGPSWAPLGPSWARLGPSWAPLGPSGAPLRPSWRPWESPKKAQIVQIPCVGFQ